MLIISLQRHPWLLDCPANHILKHIVADCTFKLRAVNRSMSTISTLQIVRVIVSQYVKRIPMVKFTLVPILVLMLAARVLEIKTSEIVQTASLEFNGYAEAGTFKKYLIVGMLSSLLIELQGFIFKSPVQRAYRTALKNSLREYFMIDWLAFKKKGIGEITASIERRSSAVSEILDVFIINLLPVCIVLLLAVLKIYSILGLLSSLVVVVSLVSYTTVTIKMAVWRNNIRKQLNMSINESSNKLIDILTNYDCILAFNNQNYELHKYDGRLADNERNYVKLWRTFYLLNFLQRLVFCMQTGLIIYLGSQNHITSDQFVLYLSISEILAANLDKLGYMYSRFTAAIINAQMSFLDIETPKQLYPIRYYDRCMTFSNVALSFSGNDGYSDIFSYSIPEYLFQNVNLTIRRGEKIALIGTNGTGKSNFFRMLLKFHKYAGSIRIDDDELSTIESSSLRDIISYIPQETFLVSGTIKENIKYGNAMATDAEMVDLCQQLNYHSSFLRLPSGYETEITMLSGGERQKVAIARALLKNAEIFLFDEPTASLDKKSEESFFQMVKAMDKTVVVILHNLDLLDHFSRILFLHKHGIDDISKSKAVELMKSIQKQK